MKHTLLLLLLLHVHNGWSMDISKEEFVVYCGVRCARNNQNTSSDVKKLSNYEFFRQSLNRKFCLYKREFQNNSTPMYEYVLATDQQIIDFWEDSYKWKHAAINDSGTRVIVKRKNDFWCKKLTYEENGNKVNGINSAAPMEKKF